MSTPSALADRLILRRVWWLGRTEFTLFWRNRTAVLTALLLPVAMVAFYAAARCSGSISTRGGRSTRSTHWLRS